MSEEGSTAGRMAVVQIVVTAVMSCGLGVGGFVGKGAYEDLRGRLEAANTSLTELRAESSALARQVLKHEGKPLHDGAVTADAEIRARVNALAERVVRLEVTCEERRPRR